MSDSKNDGAPFCDLIEAARKAVRLAYCPYSNFPVGAAIKTHSGLIYLGANIENASLTQTKHAEEVALMNAVGNFELLNATRIGLDKKFAFVRSLAIYVPKAPGTWPCFNCRQTLSEFFRDQPIITITGPGEDDFEIMRFSELAPHGMLASDVLEAARSTD